MPLPLPRNATEISAAWLTEVLATLEKFAGARIAEVESTVIGEGVGYLSSVARVKLLFENPQVVNEGAPPTVIVKIEPENEIFRKLGQQFNAFEREVRFYREVACQVNVRLPRVYYTLAEAPNFAIVMEDLCSCTPGDQLAGMHLEQVVATAVIMAKLQAKFWNNAALATLEWMPPTWDLWRHFADHWPSFIEHCHQWLGPEHLLLGKKVSKHAQWIIDEMQSAPPTIVHCDLREDNLLFGKPGTPEEVLIVDWQLAIRGMGAYDIASLQGGSELAAERRGHSYNVLRAWHETLLASGVVGYSYDKALYHFRLASLVCLTLPVYFHVMALEGGIARAKGLCETQARRHFGTALDIDAAQILPC
jgi:Phosphotransferase enzyme family